MSEKNLNRANQRLINALAGKYQIDSKAILEEGWHLTQKNKHPILQAFVTAFLIALCMVLVAGQFIEFSADPENQQNSMALQLVINILIAPIWAGIMVLGLKNALREPLKMEQAFGYYNRFVPLAILSLASALLINLGINLFILPGVYLLVGLFFTELLVVKEGLSPFQAMLVSLKVIHRQWLNFFLLHLVFFGLVFISVVTFGIALIWVVPFYFNVKGILYREVFALGEDLGDDAGETRTEKDVNSGASDSFEA